MGTNLVWRDRPCDSCGRHDEVHVGKRSAGWSFGFRAWPHRLFNAEHPDWGYDPQSPFGFPAESRADWRRVFTERRGELRDEYGEKVGDPLGWLDRLDPPDGAQQRWEDDIRAESWRGVGSAWPRPRDEDWRDPEGFRFSAREFS